MMYCKDCGEEFEEVARITEESDPVPKNYRGMIYYVSPCCLTTSVYADENKTLRIGQGTLRDIWIDQYAP